MGATKTSFADRMFGAALLKGHAPTAPLVPAVLYHHEHFDGSGYPDGLRDEQIPVGSRIVLVADAFNAITTDRPYRQARSKDEALRILQDGSGQQFDPLVVDALVSVAGFL